RPPGLAFAERIPPMWIGEVAIEFVDVVRPADQLPLLVIEGDVEVVRVHQFADDGVYRPVELLQVPRRARQLRYAIEGVLNVLGSAMVAVGRFELGRAPSGIRDLRRNVGVACHQAPIPAAEVAFSRVCTRTPSRRRRRSPREYYARRGGRL